MQTIKGRRSEAADFRALWRGWLWVARPGVRKELGVMIVPPAGPEGMFENEPQPEGAAEVAAAGEALQALCQELNLDEGSAAEALDDFTTIRGNYSLEVSGSRWGGRTRPSPRHAPATPLARPVWWWEFPPPKGVPSRPGAE